MFLHSVIQITGLLEDSWVLLFLHASDVRVFWPRSMKKIRSNTDTQLEERGPEDSETVLKSQSKLRL